MSRNTILEFSRLGDGLYRVFFLGRSIYLEMYLCRKKHGSLGEEVSELGLEGAASIIPRSMVSNPSQIVQGAIHLSIYGDKLSRFRNKGLLLMMLSTGHQQLSTLLQEAEKRFLEDEEYYLVKVYTGGGSDHAVSTMVRKPGNCRVVETPLCSEDCAGLLVKNLYALLALV